MRWLKRLYTARLLRRHQIPDALWREVADKLVVIEHLSASEKARLRTFSTLFLHQKRFSGARGFEVSSETNLIIALQAVLPILELGMDAYLGWSEIIVYPGAFRVMREQQDASGIVHLQDQVLSGESWSHGPVILSWSEIEEDMLSPVAGRNVVIHEFAHKLDALNGRTNGMPPLHPDMEISEWSEILGSAYSRLQHSIETSGRGKIDAYAATAP
ncbi:MAG: M90 family metallopeptidase, partial [Pseudomonadota bacterium]|nr:M90 family metallopeptidase [Pseudomonadota bacterium]